MFVYILTCLPLGFVMVIAFTVKSTLYIAEIILTVEHFGDI